MMRILYCLLATCFLVIPVAILAQSKPLGVPNVPQAAFIEPGNDYHIRFPDDRNPFMYDFSEIAETHQTSPDGTKTNVQNIPVRVKIWCDIFRALQLHGDSWLLVEHPTSSADYGAWSGKHRAAFLLKQPNELSAQQLASLNESASREIKLSQTWVNLNHAITVRPVSAESLDVREE